MNTLILASASPRRRELLRQIGIDAEVLPSRTDETTDSTAPEQIVQDLARCKCMATAEQLKGLCDPDVCRFVLGADTIVVHRGEVLGKPSGPAEAEKMLHALQGDAHRVYTGVCIQRMDARGDALLLPESGRLFASCTTVQVAPMSEEEIRDYVCSGEPLDKAGAYGIQGRFARHITGIIGDYTTVVGLPVAAVYQALKELGFFA